MARPIKNNADYFPHDADMRNDTRIKAVRRKFGIEGYGIYCMLLEFLTDSEYFEFKNDDLSIELVAGDFDIEPTKLTQILQYFMQIDLIQMDAKTSIISCKSLDNRLEPLLSKRKRDRTQVIDSDNTQSRVEESRGKEIGVEEKKVQEKNGAIKIAIEDRANEFMGKVAAHIPEYGKEMLRDFFDYWTEMNEGGKKMRFEMQKVFDIAKRLRTWSKNNKLKSNGTANRKGVDVNAALEHIANHIKGGQ